MKVVKINSYDWAKLATQAHLVVFNENKDSSTDRIDFTLATENEKGVLLNYVTCREIDKESLYWQYGGSFPSAKGTILSYRATQAILRFCKENYKRVNFYVENTNLAMLKMAMLCGFRITGVRNYKGSILLEHLLEF